MGAPLPLDGAIPPRQPISFDTSDHVTPFDRVVAEENERECMITQAAQRLGSVGGRDAIVVSGELLQTFRRIQLSEKDQEVILNKLNSLHTSGLIDLRQSSIDASARPSIVPKTARTLAKRGEFMLPSASDVRHREHTLDSSGLLQLQDRIVILPENPLRQPGPNSHFQPPRAGDKRRGHPKGHSGNDG